MWLGCPPMTEPARDGAPSATDALPEPGSVEALLVEVCDALDADLDTLTPADWALPVGGGRTVQEAIAHLTAVHDRAIVAMIEATGLESRPSPPPAGGGEPIDRTRAAWRASVARLRPLARCDRRRIPWRGYHPTPTQVVLDRAFDTWLHANDIRRATNRASLDPSGEHFKLLCNLAIEALPWCLAASGEAHDARITVNLSGAGGGAWTVALGRGCSSGEESTLAASARDLCLLVGDRIDPMDFACTVRGSDAAVAAARALVESAPYFARR